jgi:hypothetical protein
MPRPTWGDPVAALQRQVDELTRQLQREREHSAAQTRRADLIAASKSIAWTASQRGAPAPVTERIAAAAPPEDGVDSPDRAEGLTTGLCGC